MTPIRRTDPSGSDPATTGDDAPASTAGPTTTVAPLADLPPCPVDALDAADGPVEITFWHGMANELETALIDLVDGYNASQDRVRVVLQNQTAYESAIDKYIASNTGSRPDIIQLPEYIVQSFAQSDTFVPMQACIDAAGFDLSPILPRVANTYVFEGIQWAMPFNVSSPVLYYNRLMFEAAGLDPDDPPVSLEELRAVSQQIVDSGAAAHGIVLDSGRDSGGGWFFEQWFGRAGEPFADNGNGRIAPATKVLFDNETGLEILTYLQDMIQSGLAVSVGDNAGGQDSFFKMIDAEAPGASTIATSAAISSVIAALGSGVAPGLTTDDIGIGPMPGPSDTPAVQPGGASVWIPAGKSDEVTAAAWDFTQYLVDAAGAVDVGRGDRIRADPQRRRRTRPDRDAVRRTIRATASPTTRCSRRPTIRRRSCRRSARSARSGPRPPMRSRRRTRARTSHGCWPTRRLRPTRSSRPTTPGTEPFRRRRGRPSTFRDGRGRSTTARGDSERPHGRRPLGTADGAGSHGRWPACRPASSRCSHGLKRSS